MGLKIYGVLRSRASRNVWLAKELGIAFELVPIVQAYRLADPSAPGAPLNTRSPAFRAVNPNGHIPTVDDNGFVLHESLAINLYLAKKHGGPLAPVDLREDAAMTMWALWAANEVEPHSSAVVRAADRKTGDRDPAVAAAVAALKGPFGVLDAALRDGGGYLVGGRFTVADINTAEVVRYAQTATELFTAVPHLAAWLAACQGRPAYQEMMRERAAEPEQPS